ncbi:hypothetical protein ACLMJK_006389 [Lecanora helva]
MSSEQQGKRAACDRCRGQKLRCLREPQAGNDVAEKCIRCNTARAVCSFSQSKRAGRPPASAIANSAERKPKGKPASSKKKQSGSNQKFYEHKVEIHEEEKGTEPANTADDLISKPFTNSYTNNTTWDPVIDAHCMEEGSVPSCDHGEHSNLTSLDYFSQDYNWSFPSTSSSSQFRQPKPPDFASASTIAQFETPYDFMSDPISSILSTTALEPPQMGMHMFGEAEPGGLRTVHPSTDSTIHPCVNSEFAIAASMSNNPGHDRRTQELSELGASLNSQVMAFERSRRVYNSDRLATIIEKLVQDVVKSSTTFLNLLTSLYPSSTQSRPTSKSSMLNTTDEEFSPSETSIFSEFSDLTTNTTATSTSSLSEQWSSPVMVSNTLRNEITANQTEPTAPVVADMSTVIQLLTCYIRILRLHDILYTQIHECFNVYITSPNDSGLPVFPSIELCGLSMDSFPNLQMRLLLQIAAYLLGEIEKLLGPPAGYRISKKNMHDHWGILEASIGAQYVEVLMEESTRTSTAGTGEDMFQRVRETLASLRVSLKGTIDI